MATTSGFEFTRDFLQAVSDWQRGGDAKQNRKRGERLKAACANLPAEFRESPLVCHRQVGLTNAGIWDLFAENHLTEKISSWTIDPEVAKAFKNGVPPNGGEFRGVIYSIHPPAGSVIVSLWALYRDDEFLAALEEHKPQIEGFDKGAGCWGNSQIEVVLEIDKVSYEDVYTLGGWSSAPDSLDLLAEGARQKYGRTRVTPAELDSLLIDVRDVANQPMWLLPELTKGVIARTLKEVPHLKVKKELEQRAKK
ncbi:hypothetical protein [Pseudoxanthomonas winnipegensis]|uniref:hypothetical protein n=1 Tax=Pseudoxanthomonas winnipegensis TaxID=2480810 RepID=UPI00197E7604|nr:hypothetical protein [Pseudoxanthomonas winnipegensis]